MTSAASSENSAGPVPGPLGRLMARVYAAGIARRNRRFDSGKGVVEFDRPVISIGNLTVGGTGKTPLVAWVITRLLEAGHHPVIAMRGYRSTGGFSDEAAEYAALFPGLPIIAQPDRASGLIDLFASAAGEEVDCIVLDDGFQHRHIARQMDVVLVDATRDTLNDRLLPAGWLREPLSSLSRATHIVITHAESAGAAAINSLEAALKHVGAPTAIASHHWQSLIVIDRAVEHPEPIHWLNGKRLLAVCAIGNPTPFLVAARNAAGRDIDSFVLPDHDPYTPGTLRTIIERARAADAVLTTGKDWVKLARIKPEAWPCAIARPKLGIRFLRATDDLHADLLKITKPSEPSSQR